jgi:hypothetical protein
MEQGHQEIDRTICYDTFCVMDIVLVFASTLPVALYYSYCARYNGTCAKLGGYVGQMKCGPTRVHITGKCGEKQATKELLNLKTKSLPIN